MRKHLLTTAAVAAAIAVAICLAGCSKKLPQEPVSITYDTLTDERDGQTYRTVKIGEQTWIAQNLNYKTDSSWCYYNDTSSCNEYGRLYNWKAAINACPKGWRLSIGTDWAKLIFIASRGREYEDYRGSMEDKKNKRNEVVSKKLKSKKGWFDDDNGTDDFGFSALPGGKRSIDGEFVHCGYWLNGHMAGYWWSITESRTGFAHCWIINSTYKESPYIESMSMSNYDTRVGLSVRCVADRP